MILINTTCSLDPKAADLFVDFYRDSLKKKIEASRFVEGTRLLKLLQNGGVDTGITFALQVEVSSRGAMHGYLQEDAVVHQKERTAQFGAQLVEFTTVLQEV